MNRPMLMLALAVCLGSAAAQPALAAPAKAHAAPAPQKAAVARYAESLLTDTYAPDGPGAAVLVARGDTVLYRGARGMADIEGKTPLRPDSVFRLGSVTKQFAAAGLLKLVEAGRVSLDDPLSKYVPDYPGGDRITVLQLLNHTAGVPNYTAIPGYMAGKVQADRTTAEMIGVFKTLPADFPPGSKWSYSNSGYVLVGAVIEAVTGLPWHVYLDQTFFKPLGMRHTGYGHDPRFAAQQVKGYSFETGKVGPMRILSMTQPHAAGALVSNVDDLLIWNRALHEGRVLKTEAYTRMITPVGAAAASHYGFGIRADTVRGAPVLSHNGGIFGFSTALSYAPGPDITVVVLENDDGAPRPDSPDSLSRKLMAAALGQPYPALKAVPVDAGVLSAAEGVYRFDGEVVRTLRLTGGKLTAQRGTGQRTTLTPIGPDDFLYEDGFNRLTLIRDAKGAVTGIRFYPNGEGDGLVGLRTNEAPPAPPPAVALPRAALERVTGTYAAGGLSLKIYIEGETLTAQLAGQPPIGLRATSPVLFAVEGVDATLEFPAGDGPAGQVTLRQGGREVALKRTP